MKKIVHQATDGKDFDTKEACEKHECELMFERIIEGADFAKIGSAIDGSNPELAAALEWVGNKCVVSRRASGALKRAPKKVAE